MTEGIIITDIKGNVTDINSTGLNLWGYHNQEDVLGENTLQWLGKDLADVLDNTPGQCNTNTFFITIKNKDGYNFDAEINTTAIRDKTGQVKGLIFSIRDITAQKIAETVLRESEEKYRIIFESANEVMILLDDEGKIIDLNPRIRDVGGYDREELLGKKITLTTKIFTKKSQTIIQANFLKRMSGTNIPTYEVEMYKKNGEIATVEVNAKPVKRSGKIIGDMVVLRDVSERRKTESQLMEQKALTDRILASSPNAVAVIGQDRRLITANRAFELLFQLGKGTGEGLDIGLLTQVPELVEAISRVIANGQSITAIEFGISYDITESTMLADIVNMGNSEVLLTIRDITGTVERQEKLYLTDRLTSVGEMASGVAHELNNPLTSIIGLSNLLTEEQLPDNVREDIGLISVEAHRASRIVKNLLTFARRHETERRLVKIEQIIDDVLKLRAYENKVNNIEIKTNIPNDLPQIMADYFQIQQVFLNIILNAEQAMKESHGSGTLIISAEKTGKSVKVSFTDDGPGITKENLKHIFDPFFTTKMVGKGTGLGLSICYGIITDHNGKIQVDSRCGRGTTFIIELPVYDP
jgi:PAS domain S-box-containing protein